MKNAAVAQKAPIQKPAYDSWVLNFVDVAEVSKSDLSFFMQNDSLSKDNYTNGRSPFNDLNEKRATLRELIYSKSHLKVKMHSRYYIGIAYIKKGDDQIHTISFPSKHSKTYPDDIGGVKGSQIICRIWQYFKESDFLAITLQEVLKDAKTANMTYFSPHTYLFVN